MGNDYVHGALAPEEAADIVHDVFVNGEADICSVEFALVKLQKLAMRVWSCTGMTRRHTQRKYQNQSAYIEAFKRAFQIYHTGRFWKFGDGIVPSVEDFVEGRFRLVPGGMLQTVCRTDAVGGGSAADPVLFVKSPELQEVRIMKDINFEKFPPEALPECVLRWWLLSRGHESEEEDPRSDLLVHVRRLMTSDPIPIAEYKTQYSVLLAAYINGTPRIPTVHWSTSPQQWKVNPVKQAQKLDVLKHALDRCDFSRPNCKGKTHKEIDKARRFSREGHVDWSAFAVKVGRTDTEHGHSSTATFTLQCIPSFKTEPYHVELVFVEGATAAGTTLVLNNELSFCACKRGSIIKKVCAHRSSVYFWLRHLAQGWATMAESPMNFHEVAKNLKIARPIVDTASVPMLSDDWWLLHKAKSAEKQARNAAKRAKQTACSAPTHQWEESSAIASTEKYLRGALALENATHVKKLCSRLRDLHASKSIDLMQHPQLCMLVHVVHEYTRT